MNKIKIILLCVITITFTGCTAEYTLEIDENLTFTESMKLEENNDFFILNNSTSEEYINNKLKYRDDLDTFDYDIIYNDDTTIFKADYFEKSIEDYQASSLLINNMFSTLNVEIEKEKLSIYATDYTGHSHFGPRLTAEEPDYSSIKIIIKSPLKLISTNADVVDEENGVYIWNYDDEGYQDKFYEFEDNLNDTGQIDENILKTLEISFNTDVDIWTKLKLLFFDIWYIFALVITVAIFAIYIKGKKYANNKI